MKKKRHIIAAVRLLIVALVVCVDVPLAAQPTPLVNPEGRIVVTRFRLPAGYERLDENDEQSFAYYLRHLPMQPDGRIARYVDGSVKPNDNIYAGLLDIDAEDLQRDVQLCIRLRGEYLFEQLQYAKIGFTISNRDFISYTKWAEGIETVVNDRTYWTKSSTEIDRYHTFRRYLNFIFLHSGISTLLSDVQPVMIGDIMPGDMLVQTARPGHAVIVLDVAENPTTGDRIYLLAQSYRPAQTPQVLVNPNNSDLSPWYSISAVDDRILTPEYLFYKRDLRRFREVSTIAPAPNKKKNPVFYF